MQIPLVAAQKVSQGDIYILYENIWVVFVRGGTVIDLEVPSKSQGLMCFIVYLDPH